MSDEKLGENSALIRRSDREYLETTKGTFERPTNCWTTSSNHVIHYSPQCRKYGDGQCDGYCPNGDHCTCPCHGDWDLPQTVVEVEAWHHEFHGVEVVGQRAPFEVIAEVIVEVRDGDGEPCT